MSKNDITWKRRSLEKFKYILVYLDVYYDILIAGCFNYL